MPENQPTDPTATDPTTDPSTGSAGSVEFDGEFDAERAKRKIAAMAEDKAKLQERLAKFEREAQERADAEKSELQKAIERAERAEKAAAEHTKAEMKRTALKAAGLDDDMADFIHGDTAEELAARAKALAERLGTKPADADLKSKPKAKLTPGHESTEDTGTDFDPIASADAIYGRLR